MWSLLCASDCGDLCSKSFVLAYLCGLSCVLEIVETCVRSPPGGGLAQSVYSCTPPVRRGRRAGSLSYSFRQLDCDCSLRKHADFLNSFPLGSSLRIWGFQKVLSNWITWRWREIKQAKHYTIFLGLYQVTRPLTSECANLDKSMLKCIECTLNLVYTFEMTLLVSDSNIFKMTPA